MRASKVLQKLLPLHLPQLHAKRLQVLMQAVDSAVTHQHLTLSSLARGLSSKTTVKHRIKCMDRLLGNAALQAQRSSFYRVLCGLLVRPGVEPIILIDWSDLKADRRWLLLRATLWTKGHALVLYEEIHPLRRQNSPRVERDFLLTLKSMLPEGVRPVIVTDAGFRGPWFAQVERLGWHWVGRVRGRTFISIEPGQWVSCRQWFPKAKATPKTLGAGRIVRNRPVDCTLVLYRKLPQGRHQKTVRGPRAKSRHAEQCARREREPWLLAASPSLSERSALDIVNVYRTRMRIEQSFRTLKSHQFGFGYEDSQSRGAARIAMLLLIHLLAVFLAWIAGITARRRGLQDQCRSNSDRKRHTLSDITLGWMVLAAKLLTLTQACFEQALRSLWHPPSCFNSPTTARA